MWVFLLSSRALTSCFLVPVPGSTPIVYHCTLTLRTRDHFELWLQPFYWFVKHAHALCCFLESTIRAHAGLIPRVYVSQGSVCCCTGIQKLYPGIANGNNGVRMCRCWGGLWHWSAFVLSNDGKSSMSNPIFAVVHFKVCADWAFFFETEPTNSHSGVAWSRCLSTDESANSDFKNRDVSVGIMATSKVWCELKQLVLHNYDCKMSPPRRFGCKHTQEQAQFSSLAYYPKGMPGNKIVYLGLKHRL